MLEVLVAVVTSPPAGGSADEHIVNVLAAAGHNVSTQASTVALPDVGFDVCVVTESGSSSSAANASIAACLLPVVHMETNWNTTRMASVAATAGGTDSANIDILNTSTSITDGLSDPAAVKSVSNNSTYGVATANLASGAIAIADHGAVPGHVVVAAAEAGATLTSGTAPARRVESGLGIGGSAVGVWSATGDTLFVQAVEWAAGAGGGPPPTVVALALEQGGFLMAESGTPIAKE